VVVVGVIPVVVGVLGCAGWFATGQDKLIPLGWLAGGAIVLVDVGMPLIIWSMMKLTAQQFALNEAERQDGHDGADR